MLAAISDKASGRGDQPDLVILSAAKDLALKPINADPSLRSG